MWQNVIGQTRVKQIVRNALELKKLPSAYLFSGPEGTGKDAMALELAKALNCLDPDMQGLEACDICANCQQIASFTSPVVTMLYALAKDRGPEDEDDSKAEVFAIVREQLAAKASDPYHNIDIPRATSIQVGQIRTLRLALSRTLAGGKKRVVIISEADMMNAQAQNAFLKTLEEPHDNTIIILTSSNANKFYSTILSRCQEIRFDILAVEEIAEALKEREELSEAQAQFLARLSAGSYSRARSMIGEDVQQMRSQIVQFMQMGLSKSRQKAFREITLFLPKSGGGAFLEKRQAVEQRLTLLMLWLRDALAISTDSDEACIINLDQKDVLVRFVSKFGDPHKLITAIAAVERAQELTRIQVQLRPVMIQLVSELELALV